MAVDWNRCFVIKAGPADDGATYIFLRHTANGDEKWFKTTHNLQKEMLAVALTAVSTNRNVDAWVDFSQGYTEIQRLYIV